jgi:uncharacterized protein YkwD
VINLRMLSAGSTAILACACTSAALDTVAAQAQSRSQAPTAGATASASGAGAGRGAGLPASGAGHARRHAHTSRHPAKSASPEGSQSPASMLQSVLATPCANTELTPEAGNLEEIDAATLCLVNQERARNGEPPLQLSGALEEAAQDHSEEMVSEDYFAHIAPSGLTPVGRAEETGYIPNRQVGYTLGENIAWGTLQLSMPSAIVAAWIASPKHLANILYGPYRDTAIGVAPEAPASLAEGQPGAVYTQEFGVIVP